MRYLTRLAIYTCKPASPGEKKKRYYRLVVKRKFLGREINVTGQWSWILESRQLLGREKRDINETCHMTTASEKAEVLTGLGAHIVSRQFLGREKRDVNNTSSIYL